MNRNRTYLNKAMSLITPFSLARLISETQSLTEVADWNAFLKVWEPGMRERSNINWSLELKISTGETYSFLSIDHSGINVENKINLIW